MNSRRGFSIVELVMVVAIMLAIAAMALPKFLTYMANYDLRGGLNSIAGILQQTRVNAVRQNAYIRVRGAVTDNSVQVYGDTDDDATWDTGEPGTQLPTQIRIRKNGFPGDAYAAVSDYSPESQVTPVRFNARGLPCVMSSNICQNLDESGGGSAGVPVGFVIYVQNTGKFGQTGWGAVTVSPAGRIETWIWNGTAYSKQ